MAGAGNDDLRRLEDEEAPDDHLADEVDDEEEGEGEELFGDNMMDDYRADPENDRYDPAMLDETGAAEPLTIEQRLAAERAMDERDGRSGGRRRPLVEDPMTPGAPLGPSSPGGSPGSDDPDTPGTDGRRKRRRVGEEDDLEDELPEATYDLSNEDRTAGQEINARLARKIKRSFEQFLRKFVAEKETEPKYPDLLRKMAEENHMHLDVNFTHIQQHSARLALWIADEPARFLPLLNETLMDEAQSKFETYADVKRHTDEQQLRVGIHNFPIQDKIRDLNSKAMNKLVCVHGVCTKRSNVHNQVKRLYLRCAKCNYLTNAFEVADEKDLRPNACIECNSRGPWRVDRQKTLYRNYQKITLQEAPGSVDPGKMPRSKDVILSGDLADTVRPGDEMSLTAIYKGRYDPGTNARHCFPVYKTELEAVHIRKRGDMKAINISDEQLQQILELAKSPNIKERIIASMAPSIYGMPYVKTSIALSMFGGQRKVAAGKHRIRGDLNTLIVGDPGLAKSQFLKYVEQTFPKAVYTTGKGASAVGLTAALARDEHGEWCLEGGAMVLADDGVCLIDEFDKMNDQDRTSLHEAMEQQTISISKAGIVATLQARCAVIAVANPVEGRYDPGQTFSQNVNLTDPILSRFDLLCVLRDEADAVQDERLADHVVCSHIRSHEQATADDKLLRPKLQQKTSNVEPIPQDVLQRYIVYARQRVFPKVMDLDKEKLANFYKDIRNDAFRSGGAPMTARHVESIIRIAEAYARMELRQHVNARDLDNAISTVLESFIQSQKLQVAEELRRKHRRYIRQLTPMADQIMELLDKLFKQKIEHRVLARPGELPPDVTEIAVDMAEVVAAIERNDIDLQEAHAFMRTARFQQNFREADGKLYRLV